MKVVTLFACASILIAAQTSALQLETGLMGNKAWTHDDEIRDPYGFSIYVMPRISRVAKFKMEYSYFRSDHKSNGPHPFEPVPGDSRYRSVNTLSCLSLGVLHQLCGSKTTFLEVGGGFCAVLQKHQYRNLTTGATTFPEDELRFGLNLDMSILVVDLKDIPLVMRFGFSHKFITPFVSSSTSEGDISSDNLTTTEVKCGFGYQFGKKLADH